MAVAAAKGRLRGRLSPQLLLLPLRLRLLGSLGDQDESCQVEDNV